MKTENDFSPLIATASNLQQRFYFGLFLGFAFGFVLAAVLDLFSITQIFHGLDKVLVCG